jgi:hypothetical protein
VLAVNGGWLDGLVPAQAPALVVGLWTRLRGEAPDLAAALDRGEPPGEADLDRIRALAEALRAAGSEAHP